MYLQTLLTGDQAVIRVWQIAVRREPHHVARAGNRFQTRMSGQRKPPPEHVLRQPVDCQRNKLMRLIAQQRRGIAAQRLTQRGDQSCKTILMANIAL